MLVWFSVSIISRIYIFVNSNVFFDLQPLILNFLIAVMFVYIHVIEHDQEIITLWFHLLEIFIGDSCH
ncbi:hypothetical protein GLYMA_06G227600v4 [Glycine max]|uniref:Uncharacterized protein n=1 Tax=Glycine max TaxID=3847 RepID=K7KWR8_SOYBN|nr:hypothetical protein JHK85_016539 [Glycine max]KAH1127204.1 hypothetical protein GYH30_015966 [Glycine max]KRH55063.1 hypothetical protein GLYMA_06G227600v4 [Glycine max]